MERKSVYKSIESLFLLVALGSFLFLFFSKAVQEQGTYVGTRGSAEQRERDIEIQPLCSWELVCLCVCVHFIVLLCSEGCYSLLLSTVIYSRTPLL